MFLSRTLNMIAWRYWRGSVFNETSPDFPCGDELVEGELEDLTS